MRQAQVLGHLFRLHHRRAPLGKRGLLALLRRETAELFDRMAEPFRLAAGALDVGAMRRDRGFARAPLLPQAPNLGGGGLESAEGVEQRAVRSRLDEGALVVLPVDFHQRRAERAQHLNAHRLIVDEGAGPPVGDLHAPHDQLVLAGEAVLREQAARRMLLAELEDRGHLPLLGAFADQRRLPTRAEREREGIEQDRFAGSGLAGQCRQPGAEINVEPVDQDDVADGKPGEHGGGSRMSEGGCQMISVILRLSYDITCADIRRPHLSSDIRRPPCDIRHPSPSFLKARLIQESLFSLGSTPADFMRL